MVISSEIFFGKALILLGILTTYSKGAFMTVFFAAIVLVFCGGVLPLFLWRQFTAMKIAGALAMGAGCLIGLVDAVMQLFQRPLPDSNT